MPNSGVAFDAGLIQPPGQANASLAGFPLRLNPTSVSLPFKMKINQTQTLGGMVIQLYGVAFGDLTVSGQFGAGGWQEQAKFFQFIQTLVQGTANAQFQQVLPDKSLINPSGSVRFLFPLLGYDLNVFIKSYTSHEGSAVELTNENINPTWTLTMTIDNDNTGLVQAAVDNYIARLAAGVGYSLNSYNSTDVNPTATVGQDLQNFLQQYSAFDPQLAQQLGAAQGVNTGSSSTTGISSPVTGGTAATSANVNLTIIGPSTATQKQMLNFWGNRGQPSNLNAPIASIIGWYLSEGQAQNVRGDVAFAQACLETGYFTNSDTSLNNFAGIAHYNNAPSGQTFNDAQLGVRAHIQLLYKVAQGNSATLANPDVSPAWGGKQAVTWDGLSQNWAYSSPPPNPVDQYTQSIMTIYSSILSAPAT